MGLLSLRRVSGQGQLHLPKPAGGEALASRATGTEALSGSFLQTLVTLQWEEKRKPKM